MPPLTHYVWHTNDQGVPLMELLPSVHTWTAYKMEAAYSKHLNKPKLRD